MRRMFLAIVMGAFAQGAVAADIDPSTLEFPWMNGPTRDARYVMADHPNAVHVFEAYSLSCSWCNRNASQVKAMAEDFRQKAEENTKYERVQFVDLGLDRSRRDYEAWISRHEPSYPVVKDADRVVWDALKQDSGIPQTFVVDCEGQLVDSTIGYWGASQKRTLRRAVETALEKVCD